MERGDYSFLQLSRADGSTRGITGFCATTSEPPCGDLTEQQNGSSICVQSGRNKEPASSADCSTDLLLGGVQSVVLVSLLPSRGGEYESGHLKQTLSGLKRMDIESEVSPMTVCLVGHPGSGFNGISPQCPAAGVLLSVLLSQSQGSGCAVPALEFPPEIRISSNFPNPEDATQDSSAGGDGHCVCPILAQPSMVPAIKAVMIAPPMALPRSRAACFTPMWHGSI